MENKKYYYANYDEHNGKLNFTIKDSGKFTTKRQALEAYEGYISYIEHLYPTCETDNVRTEIDRTYKLLGVTGRK